MGSCVTTTPRSRSLSMMFCASVCSIRWTPCVAMRGVLLWGVRMLSRSVVEGAACATRATRAFWADAVRPYGMGDRRGGWHPPAAAGCAAGRAVAAVGAARPVRATKRADEAQTRAASSGVPPGVGLIRCRPRCDIPHRGAGSSFPYPGAEQNIRQPLQHPCGARARQVRLSPASPAINTRRRLPRQSPTLAHGRLPRPDAHLHTSLLQKVHFLPQRRQDHQENKRAGK